MCIVLKEIWHGLLLKRCGDLRARQKRVDCFFRLAVDTTSCQGNIDYHVVFMLIVYAVCCFRIDEISRDIDPLMPTLVGVDTLLAYRHTT